MTQRHYQDANIVYAYYPDMHIMAAYSFNLYMYIILGWVQFYHRCNDVLYYFFTEPTKQYMDFISYRIKK